MKSCSSISSICGQVLERCEFHMPRASLPLQDFQLASLLDWLHSLPVAYLSRLSTFLAFQISWALLHFHSFTRCCLPSTLPGLSQLPLKSEWKPPEPTTPTFWMSTTLYHTDDVTVCCQASLHHIGTDFWVPEWLTSRKLLVGPECPRVPEALFSKQSHLLFHLWACVGWGLAEFWEAIKSFFI